jgi:hypothetical protein
MRIVVGPADQRLYLKLGVCLAIYVGGQVQEFFLDHLARQLDPPRDFTRFHLLVPMDRDNLRGLMHVGAPPERVRLMRSFDRFLVFGSDCTVREAPEQINDLVRWGTHFDEEDGQLALHLGSAVPEIWVIRLLRPAKNFMRKPGCSMVSRSCCKCLK